MPPSIKMMVDEDDREFMTQLFLKYRGVMFSEIYKILHNTVEAEDVLQEALIRLCDKVSLLRELDERKKINYVITTVKNQAKNHIRNQHIVSVCPFDDESSDLVDISDDTDIEQNIILKEQLKDLASIWGMLDETSQFLLEGKYILNQSDEELGKILRVNPSSIRMMLTRARRKALKLLENTTDNSVL